MSNLEFIELPMEKLLGVLARRDDDALDALATSIANLAREKRRALTASEPHSQSAPPADQAGFHAASYQLGAIEALETFAVRASARAPMNARFEVVRRRHALDLLQTLALAPNQTSTPTQLAEALQKHRSNISRLIEAMVRVGVVKPGRLPAHLGGNPDGRSSPLQITPAGIEMLDGLKPDWRSNRPAAKDRLKSDAVINPARNHIGGVYFGRIVRAGPHIATVLSRRKGSSNFRVIKISVADRAAMAAPLRTVNAPSPVARFENRASVATSPFRALLPGTSTFIATKA